VWYGKRLSAQMGRNRMTIEDAHGRWHYDVAGRAHGRVPTPHKMWQPRNRRAPHGWGNSDRRNVVRMTWRDLRRVRRAIR
jgi:hypothetical protein